MSDSLTANVSLARAGRDVAASLECSRRSCRTRRGRRDCAPAADAVGETRTAAVRVGAWRRGGRGALAEAARADEPLREEAPPVDSRRRELGAPDSGAPHRACLTTDSRPAHRRSGDGRGVVEDCPGYARGGAGRAAEPGRRAPPFPGAMSGSVTAKACREPQAAGAARRGKSVGAEVLPPMR